MLGNCTSLCYCLMWYIQQPMDHFRLSDAQCYAKPPTLPSHYATIGWTHTIGSSILRQPQYTSRIFFLPLALPLRALLSRSLPFGYPVVDKNLCTSLVGSWRGQNLPPACQSVAGGKSGVVKEQYMIAILSLRRPGASGTEPALKMAVDSMIL